MINFLVLNFISMIIINLFKINSLKKIVFFVIINFIVVLYFSNSFIELIQYLVFLISMLYIFINFYTIRYSSIRIKILNDLNNGKNIISEKDLYDDRRNRIEINNSSFMKKGLFQFILLIVKVLKKMLI